MPFGKTPSQPTPFTESYGETRDRCRHSHCAGAMILIANYTRSRTMSSGDGRCTLLCTLNTFETSPPSQPCSQDSLGRLLPTPVEKSAPKSPARKNRDLQTYITQAVRRGAPYPESAALCVADSFGDPPRSKPVNSTSGGKPSPSIGMPDRFLPSPSRHRPRESGRRTLASPAQGHG